jgi:hypothetical protein
MGIINMRYLLTKLSDILNRDSIYNRETNRDSTIDKKKTKKTNMLEIHSAERLFWDIYFLILVNEPKSINIINKEINDIMAA